MAREFTLHVEEKWGALSGSLMSYRIRPGDKCQVFYKGLLALTGHVDAYNPRYSSTHHSVTIQGRSKTGDLCDSSAEIPTGELRDVTIDQLARKAVQPFGLGVRLKGKADEVLDVIRQHPGETVHRLIERYARGSGLLPTDTPEGDLELLQVEDGGAEASVIEGVNILEASAMLREDQRHSKYKTLGQDHGTDGESGRKVSGRRSETSDGAVRRHRPLTLLNESKTARKRARLRGAWEAAVRAGESIRAEVKVYDWLCRPGKLWTPGMIVQVTSPMLSIDRTLALEGVTLMLSDKGTIAALSLVPPEAMNPKAGGAGGGGGSDKSWTQPKPTAEPEDLTDFDRTL
jgi:prophage tail gpP-like protein